MKPTLIYHLEALKHNAQMLKTIALEHNLDQFAFVTKSFCADLQVVNVLNEVSPAFLADSRLENLKSMSKIKTPKILLRLPMISEVDEVVQYANVSFNSEISTIKALNMAAIKQHLDHQICLMIDMGDLREGILYLEKQAIFEMVSEIVALSHIELIGVAVNMTCYGGVLPTQENLSNFVELAHEIENKFNLKFKIISGGNSSAYNLMVNEGLPCDINQLRFGEILTLGTETELGMPVPSLRQDTVTFEAEIIELKTKPSVPIGKIGVNAFGEKVAFVDKGDTLRAIIAVGRQDIDLDALIPIDPHVTLIGQSSDHTILELAPQANYRVGDVVRFNTNYLGLMRLSTSKYVKKEYVD